MWRRVALREDDLLLTACLAAEGSLRGWRASGLLGRESCAGAVLVGLSWGKASVIFSTYTVGMSQWASELRCNKHKMHGAHLTGGQFKVLLPSASYFLFLNKTTWAGSAGGGRTVMVQQLLLLL